MFRISIDYYKEAARLAKEAGAHALWISEDLGSSHGGLLNREHFKRYVLPALNELVECVVGLRIPVLLHSCGRIIDYMDDLAQLRISAVHPLQRTAGMDLKYVKTKYGHRLCIIGNIDSSRTLPYSSVDEVLAETKEAIDIAGPGGGYVLASDHSLHDGIPVENIIAMFKFGREYGSKIYRDNQDSCRC
jgi:uroporphyrinogen decarboxylase